MFFIFDNLLKQLKSLKRINLIYMVDIVLKELVTILISTPQYINWVAWMAFYIKQEN